MTFRKGLKPKVRRTFQSSCSCSFILKKDFVKNPIFWGRNLSYDKSFLPNLLPAKTPGRKQNHLDSLDIKHIQIGLRVKSFSV